MSVTNPAPRGVLEARIAALEADLKRLLVVTASKGIGGWWVFQAEGGGALLPAVPETAATERKV